MDFKVPSLQALVSFKVANLFYYSSFKSEFSQLSEIYHDRERNWERRLTNCREEAKCHIKALIKNGQLPTCILSPFKRNILAVHKAYHQLFSWKITYDPDNKFEVLQHGEHYAPNNFTLDGEFDDIVWTKSILSDSKYPVIDRFNLACCYWFESESARLWSELKHLYIASCEVDNDIFESEFLNSVTDKFFTALRLIELEIVSADGLWLLAFISATEKGYEHAVYYTWQNMSFFEKATIMETDRYFELMSNGIHHPKDKISFFLYSQLSEERKEDLLDWTIEYERLEILYILLTTPYAREILEEVFIFYSKQEIKMISDIFHLIANRIKQHKFPTDKVMFEVLWRSLKHDEMYYTLYNGSLFIETLAEAKSFFNLRSLIKSLSNKQKQKCLLNNYYGAGIDVVHILTTGGDFDFLKEYLLLFFIEYSCIHNDWYHCIHHEKYPCILHKCEPCTKNITIRTDASKLFEKFVTSSAFKTWHENSISEAEKTQVKEIIDYIDVTFTLINLGAREFTLDWYAI